MATLRRLRPGDRGAAFEFFARDPVHSVLARTAIENGEDISYAYGLFEDDASLSALCWAGGYVVPLGFHPANLEILAQQLLANPWYAESLVGPADQVLGLWEHLSGSFSRIQDVRERQLSMVFRGAQSPGDERVRPALQSEFDLVFPAAVAMFKEEVGFDPNIYGDHYRKRARAMISRGHTFVRTSKSGELEFKADVGALSGGVAQVQGVWVNPKLRGQGIAAPALAQVATLIQKSIAPTVCLYVSDYNYPAVRAYERAGFETVGYYATVLL